MISHNIVQILMVMISQLQQLQLWQTVSHLTLLLMNFLVPLLQFIMEE